jgi:hypothetical protein
MGARAILLPVDEFAKMDIFFVVTTIAVVIGSIAFAVIAYYLIRILRSADEIVADAKEVAHGVKEASEQVFDDVANVRGRVVGAVQALATLAGFAKRRSGSEATPRRRMSKHKDESGESEA